MFIIKKAPFSKTTDSATQPKQKHVRKNNKRQKVLSQTKGMESIVKNKLKPCIHKVYLEKFKK